VREGDGERLDFERGVVSCFCGLCQRKGERPCFRRPLVMAPISRTTIRISWLLVTAVRLMAQYQQLTSELGALSAGAQLLTGTCALSIFFSLSLSLSLVPASSPCMHQELTHGLDQFPATRSLRKRLLFPRRVHWHGVRM
jgi:hypothetical protein